ncbi:26S proteasome non-ATPase regulatory protein [Phytophthora megakarya]|uniref:26S proteasome non-ATPase regulatory protein n=1 Tax=Phytophthora megakarya TaxID=4795 RepID=A0A225UVV5_9STRA|nr:26S proteasome non-ATPase regulatory protein [Phytophthora megakarya]
MNIAQEAKLKQVWEESKREAADEMIDLIQQGLDVKSDKLGQTALSFAVANGHIDVVTLLLDRGADIAAQDKRDRTALHLAAANGHREVVSLLLERGANVAAQDKIRWTALHCACSKGHRDVASLLLERGADVAAQDDVRIAVILYSEDTYLCHIHVYVLSWIPIPREN